MAQDADPFAASWRLADGARLQALDKVTGRISVVEAVSGAPVAFGTLDIVVETCHERPPELPPDSAALLSISETRDPSAPARILFHGWMFASSPGLSALEHPVYDVIVLECLHLPEEPEEPEEPEAEGEAPPGDAD